MDAGSTLTAEVTNTPANLRPYLTFYGRNCNYLYSYSYADNDGDNPPPLNYTFDEAGFVHIRVHDRDGDYNWTQMYQLTLTGGIPGILTRRNPCDGRSRRQTASLPTRISSHSAPPSPASWTQTTTMTGSSFPCPRPVLFTQALRPFPPAMRSRIRLWRADNGYVDGRNATNPGDLLSLDTPVTRPGLYRILIDDLEGNVSEVPYRLSVSFTAAADAHERERKLRGRDGASGPEPHPGLDFRPG